MSEYKGIKGAKVRNYTSDPGNPILGQVWYNETTGALKVESATTAGVWATGTNMNTARFGLGGAGIQTASLAFTGDAATGPGGEDNRTETEGYNGTSWTEFNDINQARNRLASAGTTQTAALASGGGGFPDRAVAESWNGTSWTIVNSLNSGRNYIQGAGTATASLSFGGNPATGATESWNGTSWTELNDLNSVRAALGGTGISNTAVIAFGGFEPPGVTTTAVTESWNGTSWTELNDMNTSRFMMARNGTQTLALAAGGVSPVTGVFANTETWNGTSWTEENDLNTAVSENQGGVGATVSAGISFGGITPSVTNATEEWTGAGAPVAETITSS